MKMHSPGHSSGASITLSSAARSLIARRSTRLVAVAAMLALVAAAATVRHHLLLVPLTITVAVVEVGYVEARRRAGLPRVLCDEASIPPQRGLILMPEPAIAAALSSLTASRRSVLAKAAALVSHVEEPGRAVALARLAHAASLRRDRRCCTLTRAVVTWAVVSASAVVVIEAV